jgi:predicted permease
MDKLYIIAGCVGAFLTCSLDESASTLSLLGCATVSLALVAIGAGIAFRKY